MPLYDYRCEKCEHIEEISHSIKDSPSFKCPKCSGNMKINIGSNVSVVKFKGTGWPGEELKKAGRLKKGKNKEVKDA